MTKSDIVEKLQISIGLSRKDAIEMIESVFAIMKASFEAGRTIKISGFGNFVVSHKSPRKGRNPHTGEAMTIAARRVLTFKASPLLRQAINGKA